MLIKVSKGDFIAALNKLDEEGTPYWFNRKNRSSGEKFGLGMVLYVDGTETKSYFNDDAYFLDVDLNV